MTFERDFARSKEIIKLLEDQEVARQFYSALCNMEWVRIPEDNEEDTARVLRGDMDTYSCSWRYAGGFIAQLRCNVYNVDEDYLDFYCAGNEGYVSPLVEDALEKIGWKPVLDDQSPD